MPCDCSTPAYRWLLNNRWFGGYIRNYREGRGVPLRQKVLTLAALWLTIGLTMQVGVSSWYGRVILVGIATGVTVYLLRVKTFRPGADARSGLVRPSPPC